MERINKAAAVGVVFCSVMLAGFVGVKVEQSTVAILAGAFIGLVVAIPTTALIMLVGLRQPQGQVKTPAQPEPPPIVEVKGSPPVANFYYYQNTINVYTSRAPQAMTPFQICGEVASALNVSRYEAEKMIVEGKVNLLPPAESGR